MKSTFDKQNNEATFREALTQEEWEAELENAYNRTKGRYKIPGFRPGKAPRRFIEMHYGEGVFFDAAVDLCINRVYREELDKHPELEVFGQPEVTFEKAEEGEAFAFTLKATLFPEIKLGEYKGMKLPKIEYNVSDEDVDERIKTELDQASRRVAVDRPAQTGDITVIDYVGTVDGTPFDGGKAEGYSLKLGSNTFIPGFEDGLVGAVKGEERDVSVKFPDEYHAENLKGKDAVFHVVVKDVMTEEVPELTDEFVKERGRYETVEEYKAGTRKALEQSAANRQRSERIDAAIKAIADKTECDVADKIVDAEVEGMYEDFKAQMSRYGIDPEDYLKYNNSSPAQFRAERREAAVNNIKVRQIMREVIKAENLEVTPEELNGALRDPQARMNVERVAKQNGMSAQEFLYNDMMREKFFNVLLENNEFVLDKTEEKEEVKDEAKGEKGEKAEKAEKAEKKPAKKRTAKKAEDPEQPTDGDKAE